MKDFETRKRVILDDVLVKYGCDVCGRTDIHQYFIIDIELKLGQGSPFGDYQAFCIENPEFNICRECLLKAFKPKIEKVVAKFIEKDQELLKKTINEEE